MHAATFKTAAIANAARTGLRLTLILSLLSNALSRSVLRILTAGSAWNPCTSLIHPDLKRIAGLPERARHSDDRSRI
jgi:hypothetical protein